MTDELEPLFNEDEETVYDRIEADLNRDYEPTDESYVDSRVGSMFQVISQPIVQEHARIWDALAVDVPNAVFPSRSWGDYLDEWAAVFGLTRTAATKASGEVTFTGVAGSLIPAQTVLSAVQTDPAVDPPEFVVTGDGGIIPSQISAPTNVAAVDSVGGGLPNSTTYYYVVTALNESGETTASSQVNETTTSPNRTITITWDPVDGATGYRVWRSNATGDANKRYLATVVSPTYIDANQDSTTTETLPAENTTTGRITLPVEAVEAGVLGNAAADAISLLVTPIGGVSAINNAEAIEGGADVEDDEQLRTRVLLSFRGSGSGTQGDYLRWCLAYPGVGKATIIPLVDGPGTVGCVVMTAEGEPVSDEIIDGLQRQLDPLPGQGAGLASIDHTVTVSTPGEVLIIVNAAIEFEDGFALDTGVALRNAIISAIQGYIGQLEAGEDVIYGHVLARIHAVEGVYRVDSCEVNSGTSDVTVSSSPAEVALLDGVVLSEV